MPYINKLNEIVVNVFIDSGQGVEEIVYISNQMNHKLKRESDYGLERRKIQ
jgi:hypothetical protein